MRFLETICFEKGNLLHLERHIERMERTACHFGFSLPPLSDLYKGLPPATSQGKYRCSIVYSENIESVTILPYTPRKIKSLKVVHVQELDYSFKYADRVVFDDLSSLRSGCDEILIVKEGVVTDTTFTNIVCRKGEELYTPDTPLLEGTQRKALLESGRLSSTRITLDDLRRYDSVILINAMLPLEANIEIPMDRVLE